MVWILVLVFILIILFVAIYYLTYKVLFYPMAEQDWQPEVKFQEIFIPSDHTYQGELYNDVTKIYKNRPCITAWHFSYFNHRPTVLFFHGNSGNISHRKYIWQICQEFEFNLLLVDYRGYGKSNGDPTPQGICDDGLVAYDYLIEHVGDPNNIIIWGESLGGAVATNTASQRRCRCLILLATFASLEDIIFRHPDLPWYIKTMGIIIKHLVDNVPSKDRIRKVKDPVVIMHSKEDEIIPYPNAEILYDNIGHEFKDLITITGGHGTPGFNKEDLKRLFHYILDYQRSPTLPEIDLDNIRLTPIMNLIEETATYLREQYGDEW